MSVCGLVGVWVDGSVWVSLLVQYVSIYIILTTAVTRKRRAPAVFAFTLSRNSRQDAIIIICPTSLDKKNVIVCIQGADFLNVFTTAVSSFDRPRYAFIKVQLCWDFFF